MDSVPGSVRLFEVFSPIELAKTVSAIANTSHAAATR